MDRQGKSKKDYIYVFDALRGIAAVLIFLNHCTFMTAVPFTEFLFEKILHNGSFEVIFFFLLSGFCMQRRYNAKFREEISLREGFIFAVSKVKKFYLLYVVTMGYVAIYEVVVQQTPVMKAGIKFLFSLTLMQTFTVKYWGILNSAAWFLSVLAFLYFLTPVLIRVLYKVRKNYIVVLACPLFYIVINLVCYLLCRLGMATKELTDLLTYIFPIYWIPGYLLGMELAKIQSVAWIDNHATASELGTIILSACIYLLGLNVRMQEMDIFRHYLYIMSAACVIIVFSHEKGRISEALLESRVRTLGKYSLEIYLIHFPLITRGGYTNAASASGYECNNYDRDSHFILHNVMAFYRS